MTRDLPATIPALIDAFGGTSAFAVALGVGQSTASMMRHRQKIDVKYWRDIMNTDTGRALRIDADFLLSIHEKDDAA